MSMDVILNLPKSVQMKNQTRLHLGWPEGKYIFRTIVISGLIMLMTHPALHRFLSN